MVLGRPDFPIILAALLLNTNVGGAHKRLMLATLVIADAGFGRITGMTLENRFDVNTWSVLIG
jgi:hypothetical protein